MMIIRLTDKDHETAKRLAIQRAANAGRGSYRQLRNRRMSSEADDVIEKRGAYGETMAWTRLLERPHEDLFEPVGRLHDNHIDMQSSLGALQVKTTRHPDGVLFIQPWEPLVVDNLTLIHLNLEENIAVICGWIWADIFERVAQLRCLGSYPRPVRSITQDALLPAKDFVQLRRKMEYDHPHRHHRLPGLQPSLPDRQRG